MKHNLLLADNDTGFRETWRRLLQEAGYSVAVAGSPAGARALLHSGGIDLALLDQRLEEDGDPGDHSGFEIAREDAFRNIPKIVFTAYSVEPGELLHVPGWDPTGLPAATKVMGKGEQVAIILAEIEKTLADWSRLRRMALQVSSKIEGDYRQAQGQARYNFAVTAVVSLLGFVMIFVGIESGYSLFRQTLTYKNICAIIPT